MASTEPQKFNINEPVEIRIKFAERRRPLVLTAWVNDAGIIGYSLVYRGHGTPEALSNLQSTEVFPRKAVSGWQAEVIAFAEAGLGSIIEVR